MRKLFFLLIIVTSFIPGNVSAFDNERTHPRLTDEAMDNSDMNQYLVDNLNLSNVRMVSHLDGLLPKGE